VTGQPLLPAFTGDGLLPVGDYELTLDQLAASHLVRGSGQDGWDAGWRGKLVGNLRIAAAVLWGAGITEIFVDGSFVEEKLHPNDIDGYFVCKLLDFASGDLQRRLNALDPNTFWTWDNQHRHPYPNSPKAQLPMWHIYRVELYPHYEFNSSGLVDAQGHALPFPSAFRQQRGTYAPKGIIKLVH
jgi:hypothetical protein